MNEPMMPPAAEHPGRPGHAGRTENTHGDGNGETVRVPEAPAGAGDAGDAGDHDADAPAGPAPLGVTRTPTGNARIDARLARLADADDLPADGHPEVYEDVHRALRDTLTELDQRPGPPAPSTTDDNRS